MTPREHWIDEGMTVLREQGIDGVRIDRIAARLGLTKGSFHHHFRGVGDYRTSLLERYETDSAATIANAMAQLDRLSPQDALMALPSHVAFDTRLEAAMRGWAFQDDDARTVLERIDAFRLNALVGFWAQIVPDASRARTAAMVPYLVMVGAAVALPSPTETEMLGLFQLLAKLVPAAAT